MVSNLNIQLDKKKKVLLVSLGISFILIFLGFLGGSGVLGNSIILSVCIVVFPQLFLSYREYAELKDIEERFPTFVRNLTEAVGSGMSLPQAIMFVSKSDYGKLTPYVRKMANQLSWGLPLEKVLNQFEKRIKKSKVLSRSLRIIIETSKSGGDITRTLDTIGTTVLMIKDIEKERKSLLSQHVVLMYFLCFTFIGIIVAINRLMIPIFKTPTFESSAFGISLSIGFTNPCQGVYPCIRDQVTKEVVCFCESNQLLCSQCKLYTLTCDLLGVDKTSMGCYYVALFFFMSVIQAIFSGLVTGQIGEGSVTAGIKHSAIMVTITIGAFYILSYLGLMGV